MWVVIFLVAAVGAVSPKNGVTKSETHPQTCGLNEIEVSCKTICPPQSCDIYDTEYACNYPIPCIPGCDCIENYLRDSSGVCILNDLCPGFPPTQCGVNETYAECSVGCPPYTSCPTSDTRAIVACSMPYPCPPGCVCKDNYRRKSYEDSTCILAEECPPVNCTRPNEVWDPCPSSSLTEFYPDTNQPSDVYRDNGHNCQPECVCRDGFIRNNYDECVPAAECHKQCNANETYVTCNARCPDDYCPENDARGVTCIPPYPCPSGCKCKLNYKRRSYEDDTCILAEECPPIPCTSRPNEIWNTCPSGCLSESCFDVDSPPSVCNELVLNCQPKCVCMDGFYRNESDICIPAAECQNIQEDDKQYARHLHCGANETYVWCNVGCSTDFCPRNDSRATVSCSRPRPCPPGCRCKLNYLRKSYDDYTCILAEECPPVNCTRPHEEWSSCPSPCLRENCEDVNKPPSTCNYLVQNCQPKCICLKGYFRNENDICIPASDCPAESYLEYC